MFEPLHSQSRNFYHLRSRLLTTTPVPDAELVCGLFCSPRTSIVCDVLMIQQVSAPNRCLNVRILHPSPPYADSITLTEFLPGKGKIFSRGRVKPIFFPPGPGGVLPFEMGRIWPVWVLTGNPILIGDPTALKP